MLCISAVYAGMRCPSVCPSVCLFVTFVSCAKTNKHIFEIFSPLGSKAILVFPCQTGWRYSDWNPSNGGVECRWGRQITNLKDVTPYKQMDKNGLPSSMMSRVLRVRLIFFLCNDKNAVSYYDTLDDGCILSDHVPITVECVDHCFYL